jgi:hypothetical protein
MVVFFEDVKRNPGLWVRKLVSELVGEGRVEDGRLACLLRSAFTALSLS